MTTFWVQVHLAARVNQYAVVAAEVLQAAEMPVRHRARAGELVPEESRPQDAVVEVSLSALDQLDLPRMHKRRPDAQLELRS